MAIKGLRNFRYVKLTKDTKDELEYDTKIKQLVGAQSIKISPKTNSAELYGDDQLLETVTALGAIEVEIDVAELKLEERADLLGYKIENGVLVENKDATATEIAFGFEAPKSKSDNEQEAFRMVWLTKGKAEPLEEEGKTGEDKIELQTQKVKFKFMPRINDGVYKLTADTDLTGAPTQEEFFKQEFLKSCKKTTVVKSN
ncbi:major tail protein [Clostridium ihumii]|uniref:major tail protein n=1 Tax=Clostridium ihumii TaxID=1470356 RepID=UPI00055205A7|nr:major tail protein [Clostridium ihumii]